MLAPYYIISFYSHNLVLTHFHPFFGMKTLRFRVANDLPKVTQPAKASREEIGSALEPLALFPHSV